MNINAIEIEINGEKHTMLKPSAFELLKIEDISVSTGGEFDLYKYYNGMLYLINSKLNLENSLIKNENITSYTTEKGFVVNVGILTRAEYFKCMPSRESINRIASIQTLLSKPENVDVKIEELTVKDINEIYGLIVSLYDIEKIVDACEQVNAFCL